MSEDDFMHKLREKPRAEFAHGLYKQLSEEREMIEQTAMNPIELAMNGRRSHSRYGLTLLAAVLALMVLGGLVIVVNRPLRPLMEAAQPSLGELQPITPENAGQLQLIREIGTGFIGDVAWSVDGSQLAVGGMRGVWVYQADDVEAEPRFLPTDAGFLSHVAYSPDGKLLAGTDQANIRLWDAATGEVKAVFSSEYWVSDIAFSPDSKLLLAGESIGWEAEATEYRVQVWDVERGEVVHILDEGQGTVNYMSFSPDGSLAAAQIQSSGFKGAIVWDVATGEQHHVFQNNAQVSDFGGLAFNPVDGTLALPDERGATLWNSETGERLGAVNLPEASGFGTSALQLQFSPDGKLLALGMRNLGLMLWDMEAEQFLPKSDSQSKFPWLNSITFSPDGTQIAAIEAGEQVHIWDVASGHEVRTIDGFVGSIQVLHLLPDDVTAVTRTGSGDFHVFNLETGEETNTFQVEGNTSFVGQNSDYNLNADGTIVAYSGWEQRVQQFDTTSTDVGLQVLNLDTGEVLIVEVKPPNAIEGTYAQNFTHLDYSADGKWLVGVGMDSSVVLFSVENGIPLFDRILLEGMRVSGALFSPDSQSIVVVNQAVLVNGNEKTRVMLIELATGATRELLDLPAESYVAQVEFNDDGSVLAVAVSNSVIELVDVETAEVLKVLVKGQSSNPYFQAVAFSPDGQLLAASGGEFSLWDVETGEKLFEAVESYPASNSVRISSDGRYIVVARWDGFLQVWGVPGG